MEQIIQNMKSNTAAAEERLVVVHHSVDAIGVDITYLIEDAHDSPLLDRLVALKDKINKLKGLLQ